jgi:hypothetical protein
VKARHRYARGVLFVALAISLLATLVGVIVVARAAMRLRGPQARLVDVVATSNALVARAQEVAAEAARLRAETERLRALTRLLQ